MELRKVAVIVFTLIIVSLATFTVGYHHSKPMSIDIVNKDGVQHTVTIKVYRDKVCIYNKILTVMPNKVRKLRNVVAAPGEYTLNVTLDNRVIRVFDVNNTKTIKIRIVNSTLKID